jgi:hypothetical protein
MRHYPYPEPRLHLRAPDTWPAFVPLPPRYWDHSTHVVRWMGRNALRYLHEQHKAGEQPPSVRALATWLLEMTRRQAPQHFGYVTRDKVDYQAESAAEFALREYDPEHRVYKRAANGGRKGRPRRSPHMDALRELAHLKPTPAGRVLGIGPEQVRRLRKQIDRIDFEAELNELFGPEA